MSLKKTNLLRWWNLATLMALLLVFALPAGSAEGVRPSVIFNHDQTLFPLSGVHTNTACESCHFKGVFKGTPTSCTQCHNRGTTTIAQTTKPVGHMQTTKDCFTCHKTTGWIPALFDHSDPNLPACSTCHNGTTSTGKPVGHTVTTKECGECHLTTAWIPAGMDHSTMVPPAAGRCTDCHGSTATGKTAKHIPTQKQCDSCHTTTAWAPATFDHKPTDTDCQSCHNKVTATGKPARHVSTTSQCSVCHVNTGWTPATFDHSTVQINGQACANCHNGKTAPGKSSGHLATTAGCDTCHSTVSWKPSIFAHTPAQTGGKACKDCHNGKIATGKNAAHIATTNYPNCDTCHTTSAWKPSQYAHQNVTTSTNCTTCHNGKSATGRPTTGTSAHKAAPMTLTTCGSCHTIGTSWKPTPMNHSGATSCTSCHTIGSGNAWTPAKTNHISTTGYSQCSACHKSTTTWTTQFHTNVKVAATSNCTLCHKQPNAAPPVAGRPSSHAIVPMTSATCGSCHTVGGTLWTPAKFSHAGAVSCTGCHNVAGNAWTPARANHIAFTGQCSACHKTTGWLPATFAHAGVTATTNCTTCHDGLKATPRPLTGTKAHIVAPMTSNTCGTCHGIGKTWVPATMKHTGATGCSGCHATAGNVWTTAKTNHISTVGHAECSDCHTTTAWKPSKFSHSGITAATDCTTCHDNSKVPGRPTGAKTHSISPMTANTCGSCHKIGGAWIPGTMNHTGVSNCKDCHAYTGTAWNIAKTNHITTTSQCSACHVTTAWRPASDFDHAANGVTSSSNCTLSGCHTMTTKAAPIAGMPTTGTKAHKLVMVNATCGTCHSIGTLWNPATMSHTGVGANDCKTCHTTPTANAFTPAKAGHIPINTQSCSVCHTTAAWKPTSFAHQGVAASDNCTTCHNGTQASAKPTGANAHTVAPMNAVTCGSCHTIGGGWVPGTMNHSGLTSCTSCHVISAAGNRWTKGKTNHVSTTGNAQCSGCHSTTGWIPATFNHNGMSAATNCTQAGCHATSGKAVPTAGRPTDHTIAPMTSNTCGSCHAIGSTWVLARPINHAGMGMTTCSSCHAQPGGNAWTPSKVGHIATTSQCSACHVTAAWLPASGPNHSVYNASTDCYTGCHNVTNATGRPTSTAKAHTAVPMTNNTCGACHTPGTVWTPATMNHSGAVSCTSCHPTTTASTWTVPGKTNHISTAGYAQCSSCHTTTAWKPSSFAHQGMSSSTTCSTCHNGTNATPRPTSGAKPHTITPLSTANCGSCHTVGISWTVASLNHSSLGMTACTTCHTYNGNSWTPTKTGHMAVPGQQCSGCHVTTAWLPASHFNHAGVTPATSCTGAGCHETPGKTAPLAGRPTSGTTPHLSSPMSTLNCGSCHSIGTSWTPASMPHTGITASTDCTTSGCHTAGRTTTPRQGRGSSHTAAPMSTSNLCGACHTIGGTTWTPATMSHSSATACNSCHSYTTNTNGWTLGSPKSGHLNVPSETCSNCHTTTGWTPTSFAHTPAQVGTNTCKDCHNGIQATPPTAPHAGISPSPFNCDACHRNTGWKPATFGHTGTGYTANPCETCHKAGFATVKSAGHFVTTQPCIECHTNTTTWVLKTGYSHKTAYYAPNAHSIMPMTSTYATCLRCHVSKTESITATPNAGSARGGNGGYKPNCAWCHAGYFQATKHKHYSAPTTVYYTAAELKNCSGACHTYNQTTGAVTTTRNGPQHRTSGW